MPTASVAPKVGAPSQQSSATKVPSRVPGAGTKPIAAPAPPKAVQVSKYLLPEVTPSQVVRLFENIPEYRNHKINNLDTLIQGMLHLANQPINGIGPGGMPAAATPFNNFLAQLIMLAVEKGSKGISLNS